MEQLARGTIPATAAGITNIYFFFSMRRTHCRAKRDWIAPVWSHNSHTSVH